MVQREICSPADTRSYDLPQPPSWAQPLGGALLHVQKDANVALSAASSACPLLPNTAEATSLLGCLYPALPPAADT